MTVVVLFDVDNTLFDTERFRLALNAALLRSAGPRNTAAFWRQYEAVSGERGFADVTTALERLARDLPEVRNAIAAVFASLRFREFVFPGATTALAAAARLGTPVIVSDGDAGFQQRKIDDSGLAAAVDGRVRIYPQKELRIDDVIRAFPASRYWMVDDKRRILSAYKRALGDRITTVQVAYGRHAHAPAAPSDLLPDFTVPSIDDVAALFAG
jgi:FMN phosphatase YigB (HAD superfamily)